MVRPTAAILIVGDEILGGHTQDTNSHWLAGRLRALGVRLARIETVPDEVEDIEASLRRLAALAFDWVLVVGGLGPTPDDRTYEAVGRALDAPLEVRPEHRAAMKRRVAASRFADQAWADPDRSEAMARMIRIPRGAAPLANPTGAALGCVAGLGTARIAVFPGVPDELYAMFDDSFAPHFLAAAEADAVEELHVVGAEARYWDALNDVGRRFPAVKLGSYPQDAKGNVVLRLSGPREDVRRARAALAAAVGAEK